MQLRLHSQPCIPGMHWGVQLSIWPQLRMRCAMKLAWTGYNVCLFAAGVPAEKPSTL